MLPLLIVHLVPPYTSPGEFFKLIGKDEAAATDTVAPTPSDIGVTRVPAVTRPPTENGTNDDTDDPNYSERTYDGYQAILAQNSRSTREEELAAMREARQRNRLGQSSLENDSRLGGRYNGEN